MFVLVYEHYAGQVHCCAAITAVLWRSMLKWKRALEQAGVEFLDATEDGRGEGLRFKREDQSACVLPCGAGW